MKRKKINFVLLIILLCIGFYLNRVYAGFFDRIGEYKLPDHFTELLNAETTINETMPEKYTYLILGDSLSRGVGASSYKTSFPYLFAQSFSQTHAVKMVNRAQPGARSSQLKHQLEAAGSISPDITTILIGTNDVFNRTPVADFISDYNPILTRLEVKHTKIIVMTIPYLGPPESVPFPFTFLLDSRIKKYNSAIKDMAASHPGVEIVDLYELTKDRFKSDRSLYSKDLFHPSDKGYILISDYLAGYANLNF